jgi:hypothetical protein
MSAIREETDCAAPTFRQKVCMQAKEATAPQWDDCFFILGG